MQLPSAAIINEQRIKNFKERIANTLSNQNLSVFEELVLSYQKENEVDVLKMASALALMAQGSEPLLLNEKDFKQNSFSDEDKNKVTISLQPEPLKEYPQIQMRRYRIALGHKDKIRPGNILGAIANEAEISSDYIGTIQILQDFTVIDLPDEMPSETFEILKNTRIFNKTLNLEELTNKNNISSPREKDKRFKRESIKRNKKRKPYYRKDKKYSQYKSKR